MRRPEIDDENIEKLEEIIDEATAVPLPSDELSINQQFRIVVEALYQDLQEAKEEGENAMIAIDRRYLEE